MSMMDLRVFSAEFFARFPAVRYLAVLRGDDLQSASRSGLENSSASESDRYEELIVNPALLKIAEQRGNIDCGGLNYLVVRYGNFFQFVTPVPGGHVSICIEPDQDPVVVGSEALAFVRAQL